MAGTKGKIDELYDLQGIQSQHQTVIGLVEQLLVSINGIKPIVVKLEGAEKTKEVIDGMNDMAKATQTVAATSTAAVNEYGKLIDLTKKAAPNFEQQKKILDSLGGSLEQNIKLQVQYKIRLSEIQGDLKLLAKETNDLAKNSDDYKNKVAALTQEQLELKNANSELSTTIKQQIKENQSAEGSIDQLQARVTQLQNAYEALSAEEKQGTFGKALKASIDELEPSLKEQEATIGKFQRNVGNYSQAIKILEKAFNDVKKKLDEYNKSGKGSPDIVAALSKEYGLLEQLLENQSNGFKTSTAEIRENTKALQQMSAAGLEGTEAYRNLFAATADLKDETADLKTAITNAAPDDVAFNAASDAARGLIGVYGLAQSATAIFGVENEQLQETLVKLQAAETALQSIEAIRALFKKENAVRQAIYIGLQKVELINTNLQTAAESKNIVVKYAAIIAQKALNAAMAVAGGPIGILLGGLALLLISLSAFASSTEKATKSLAQLNAEFDRDLDNINKYANDVKRTGEERIAAMQSQFATEKDIRKQQTENLREEFKAVYETERDKQAAYKQSLKILTDVANGKREQDEKEIEQAEQFVSNYEALQTRRMDLASKIRVSITDDEKATTEESIQARQTDIESLNATRETRAAIFKEAVSNDRKSYAERIQAARDYLTLQEQIINADARKKLLSPGMTPSERKAVLTEQKNALFTSQREINKQIEELNRESAEREKQARFQIAQTEIEGRKAAAELILANENKSYAERAEAAIIQQRTTEELINGQKNIELSNEKLIGSERKVIEDRANADILQSRIALSQNLQNLTLETIEIDLRRRTAANNKERDESIISLNERYAAGKISTQKYNKERLDLEKAYSIESLDIAIESAKTRVAELKEANADTAEAEAQLAELQKNLSDAVTDKKIDDLEKLRAKEKELASEIVDTLQTVLTAAIERDKHRTQIAIDELEKKKQKEIEVANQTILNEDEKANEVAKINARAQAQREILERRQRQLDLEKAKVERLFTIGKIIADTASAVVAALPNIPLSVVIGAIGAAQLIKVLATPLPKFAEGTDDAPGGWAWLGDGGKKERVIEPSGYSYVTPDKPHVGYLPAHSIVIPDADEYDSKMAAVMKAGVLNSLRGPEDVVHTSFSSDLLITNRKLDGVIGAIKDIPKPVFHQSWNGVHYGVQQAMQWNEYVKASI